MSLKKIKLITLTGVLGLTAFLGACTDTGTTPTDGGATGGDTPTETTEPPAAPEGQ